MRHRIIKSVKRGAREVTVEAEMVSGGSGKVLRGKGGFWVDVGLFWVHSMLF